MYRIQGVINKRLKVLNLYTIWTFDTYVNDLVWFYFNKRIDTCSDLLKFCDESVSFFSQLYFDLYIYHM